MSDFGGVKINKIGGGLGRRNPSTDGVCGMVIERPLHGDPGEDQVFRIAQLSDVTSLGLSVSNDLSAGISAYYQISEFFRLSPSGVLYIKFVVSAVEDKIFGFAEGGCIFDLIKGTRNGEKIKMVGVVFKDASQRDNSLTVAKAQDLVDNFLADNVYIDSILLGDVYMAYTLDLRTLGCPNVSVVIGVDNAAFNMFNSSGIPAVGSALGMLSVRKVNENLGSIDIANKPETAKGKQNYSLTDAAKQRWEVARLTYGTEVNSLTQTEKTALKDKGYIFAGGYEGYPGIYFNGSATCTENSDDFSSIERNRTWNKAARYVIEALTPKINSTIKIDAATGYIKSSTIAAWETAVKSKINNMLADDECSAIDVYIDPKQNVLSGSPIKVSIKITPDGIAEAIEVDLGFKNPFA